MYYVEILCARTRLTWFTAIAVAAAGVFVYFVAFPPAGVHVHNAGQDASLNAVLVFAGFAASIMATMLAATLNRDRSHLPYMWTRPLPRERIALQYMLVDVVTIVLAYAVIVGVAALVFSVPPQNHLLTDSATGAILARSLAVPLMWYGLIEAATSWNGSRGGYGISWGVFWVLLILSAVSLPAPLEQIVMALNLFNPLAYLPPAHGPGGDFVIGVEGGHSFALAFAVQTVFAYLIFLAGCVVATYAWKRMEA